MQPEDFFTKEKIYSSPFAEYFKETHNNNDYIRRTIKVFPNTEHEIQKELTFLDKITCSIPKPKSFANYFGYFKHYIGNDFFYNIITEYFPISLATFLENHQINLKPLPFVTLKDIFNSLLNGLALLQSKQVCPFELNPLNLFLDEYQNVKFTEFGSFKDPKLIKSHYTQQLLNASHSNYRSPENNQFICDFQFQKLINGIPQIDPYKSEAFAFGLLMLELGCLKPLQCKNNNDILKSEIQSHLSQFYEIYCKNLSSDDEKKDFSELYNILTKVLQIQVEERWDFLDAFKNKVVRTERMIYHIFLEESTIGEIQGIQWNLLRRNPLKKLEEKKIKSIYQKDFAEYIQDIKLNDQEAWKKLDNFFFEERVEGISMGNLNKEKVVYYMFF